MNQIHENLQQQDLVIFLPNITEHLPSPTFLVIGFLALL
jgi:hypothetical protein